MTCSSCGNDNPQPAFVCAGCGTTLTVVQCVCGYFNTTHDKACTSCGRELPKHTGTAPAYGSASNTNAISYFTEQQLMHLVELQQMKPHTDHPASAVTQSDIDKLFE